MKGFGKDRCDNDKRLGNERHMLPYLGQDDDRSRNCCNSSFLSTRTIFVGNIGSPQQTVPYEGEFCRIYSRARNDNTLALRRLLFDCNKNMAYMSKVPESSHLSLGMKEVIIYMWTLTCRQRRILRISIIRRLQERLYFSLGPSISQHRASCVRLFEIFV